MSGKPNLITRGVVVGRASAGEGSMRALIYTDALGLVQAMAKSGREERSKLRAHLTTGTQGTFVLIKGANGWRVTGATGCRNAHFITTDSVRQTSIARVLALVRQLVHGEGAHDGLFEALDEFFTLGDERRAVGRIMVALGYLTSEDLKAPPETLTLAINRGLAASGLT